LTTTQNLKVIKFFLFSPWFDHGPKLEAQISLLKINLLATHNSSFVWFFAFHMIDFFFHVANFFLCKCECFLCSTIVNSKYTFLLFHLFVLTWSFKMFILRFFKHLWFLCFFHVNLTFFCDESSTLCSPWTLEIFCTHWEWLSSSLNPCKHFGKQMICHRCKFYGVHSFGCLFMTCNKLILKLLVRFNSLLLTSS